MKISLFSVFCLLCNQLLPMLPEIIRTWLSSGNRRPCKVFKLKYIYIPDTTVFKKVSEFRISSSSLLFNISHISWRNYPQLALVVATDDNVRYLNKPISIFQTLLF